MDRSGAAVEVFADAVLDGVAVTEAVREVIAHGRPGRFRGVEQLREGLVRRRAQIEAMAGIDALDLAGAGSIADLVRRAAALEYRVLFADPDDLARLEEAELLGLPQRTAAMYQALASWQWHCLEASALYQRAHTIVKTSVHHPTAVRAAEQLDAVTPEEAAVMTAALGLLTRLVAEAGPRSATPLSGETVTRLGPLLPAEPVAGPDPTDPDPEPAQHWTLGDVVDRLEWRRSAEQRFCSQLSPTDERRLSIAWQNLITRAPGLSAAVTVWGTSWGTSSREVGRSDHRPPAPGGHLFADLVDPVAEIADLDQLDHALAQDHPGARLEDVDAEVIQRTLGRPARRQWEELRRTVRSATGSGTLDLVTLRRQLPPAALRRGLTPPLRRRLAGPASDTDESALVVVVDRNGPSSQWPSVRAAALATGEMVRRHRPGQALALVVLGPGAEVAARPYAILLDEVPVAAGPDGVDLGPAEPTRVLGAVRRTLAGLRAERAVVVVIGAEPVAEAIARVGARWEWDVRTVRVGPGPGVDPVTATVRRALDAVTR